MQSIIILSILVLLAPFIGGIIYGIERKVKARMQNRMGPSIWQPFYDFMKPVSYTHLTLPTILRV